MAFDETSARDFLYLTGLLFGTGLGGLFSIVLGPRRPSDVGWSLRTLITSVVFAGSFVFLSAAFVLGGLSVLVAPNYMIVAGVVCALALAAVLFPRVLGFPLAVAIGTGIVLFSWAFLVYPRGEDGLLLGRLRMTSEDVRIWFGSSIEPVVVDYSSDAEKLEFVVLRIDFDRSLPFVGASSRIALLEVKAGDRLLASRPLQNFPTDFPGCTRELLSFDHPSGAISGGIRKNILWTRNGLSFLTSNEIK